MNRPDLSLSQRCEQSKAFNQQAASHLARIPYSTPRQHFALAAVSLAHEHHSGLIHLTSTCHFASAAALLRPLAEASVRAHWFMYAASKQKVGAVASGIETTPDLDKMINALSKCAVAPPGIHDLKRILQTNNWTRFHKYTHGDMPQLSRRANPQPFAEFENLNHLILADHFLLAGASIGTVLLEDKTFFRFVVKSFTYLNEEAVALYDAAKIPHGSVFLRHHYSGARTARRLGCQARRSLPNVQIGLAAQPTHSPARNCNSNGRERYGWQARSLDVP